MPFWAVKPKTSPAVRPALIVTVAPFSCVSSGSLSVRVVSIATPFAFSV